MVPGKTIIRACPECGRYIKQVTVEYGSMRGARFWTDGKTDAPMLPEQPWLVKCPACKSLFWVNEAEQIAALDPLAKAKKKFSDALVYENLTEVDYLEFLRKEGISKRKEQYVRIRALWCLNDPLRYEKHAKIYHIVFSRDQEDNLTRLYELLDEKDPNQRLMKAEIARERGMFDKAMALLEFSFPEGFDKAVSVIWELCKSHNTIVSEIKYQL